MLLSDVSRVHILIKMGELAAIVFTHLCISSHNYGMQAMLDFFWEDSTPHALSPDAISPDALSPRALSPNGLRNTWKSQAIQVVFFRKHISNIVYI